MELCSLFCKECHAAAATLLLLSAVWLSFHELCMPKGQADLQADKLCHVQQSHLNLPSYPRHRRFSLPVPTAHPARGNTPSSGGK